MGRKAFQDFARVLCQRFIEVPSNRDVVNLSIFGGGLLELDVLSGKGRCKGLPIDELPYSADARNWIQGQLEARGIPASQLIAARLTVNYSVATTPHTTMPTSVAVFDFETIGTIFAPDREYVARLNAQKTWGLGQV